MASYTAGPSRGRDDQLHEEKLSDGLRPAQRGRDRILYSSAWRRLVEVTQVVPAGEGHAFHNRLTHSLEVAVVARRLAERLLKEQHGVAETLGGIDPDVTEAAALAHDLGHPPFGHVAEQQLDWLVIATGVMDGFEGNPQSFRIVTKLAFSSPDHPGLNLTRATLNALLKYPSFRATGGKNKLKWGAYHTEDREFGWARELLPVGDPRKSVEAELMDWADDITYAVHDVEDFYRAGRIPLDRVCSQKDDSERKRFYDEVFQRHERAEIPLKYKRAELECAFEKIVKYYPIDSLYRDKREERSRLRFLNSGLVRIYMEGIRLNVPKEPKDPWVQIDPECEKEVFMLKQLTWHYVILDPALVTQQFGQQEIIRRLFEIFQEAACIPKKRIIFPYAVRDELETAPQNGELRTRIVTDFISGMSEMQAIHMYRRLTGHALGSVLHPATR